MSLDLRHNPGYNNDDTKQFKKIMRNSFISNIKHDLCEYERSNNRVNTEFIIPDALGLQKNHLDELDSAHNPE